MDNTANLLTYEARQGDFDQISTNIAALIIQIKELTEVGKGFTLNLKFDVDLNSIIERQKRFEQTINESNSALENMTKQFQTLSATSAEYGNITTALIKKQAEYKTEIIANEKEIQSLYNQIKNAENAIRSFGRAVNPVELKKFQDDIFNSENKIKELTSSVIKAKVELQSLTPELNAAAQGFRSQITSINELDARVKILTIDFQQLSESQRDSVGGKALQSDIQALNIELTELRAGMRGVGTETKELSNLQQKEAILTSRLTALKTEQAASVAKLNVQTQNQTRLNKLTAQEEIANIGSIDEMNAQIKIKERELQSLANVESEENEIKRQSLIIEIDLLNVRKKAVSSSATQQALNIGNYKSANAALSQTKQEMAALIIAGKQNSERYRELEIDAKKYSAAQKQVNESLNEGKTAIQQFGDMFYRQILRTVGTLLIWYVAFAAIQKLWELFTKGTEATQKLRQETEDYNTKLRELGNTATETAAKEKAASDILVQSATNINNSIHLRISAIGELRKTYKGLFDDYSDEQMMNDKTLEGYKKMRDIIQLNAGLNANVEKIKAASLRASEAEDKITDLEGVTKRAEDYRKKRIDELFNTPNQTLDQRDEYLKLKAGNVDIDKIYDTKTPEGRLEKTRLEQRSMFDKMFDKGTVNISEQKDLVQKQKDIYNSAIVDEEDYLKRYTDLANKLDEKRTKDKLNLQKFEDDLKIVQDRLASKDLGKLFDKYGVSEQNVTDKDIFKMRKDLSDENAKDLREEVRLRGVIAVLKGEKEPRGRSGGKGKNAGNEPKLTAAFDLEVQRLNQVIETNKKIVDDDKATLDIRLVAQRNYFNEQNELEQISFQKKLSENQTVVTNARNKINHINDGTDGTYKSNEEKQKELKIQQDIIKDAHTRELALQREFGYKSKKLADESQKDLANIYITDEKNWLEHEKINWAQYKGQLEDVYQKQEDQLKQSLDKKQITRKEYNKQIEAIETLSHNKLLRDEIDFDEQLLRSDRLTEEQYLSIKSHQNSLKNQLNTSVDTSKKGKDFLVGVLPHVDDISTQAKIINDPLADEKDQSIAKKKLEQDVADQTIAIVQQTEQTIKQIKDNQFLREQQQLEIQMRTVQLQAQQQIDAINASVGYQITKENEASLVVAQTTAMENNIQQQQNQLQLKKAIADKQSAESSIEMNTAEAIIKVWAGYADMGIPGIALAAAETAVIGALGAEQYSAAASAPLPQFFTGGTTWTPLFSAGEKGVELIQPPNKTAYFSTSTASVYNEPIGTKITAHDATKSIVEQAVYNVYSQQVPQRKDNNLAKDVARELSKIIGNEFEEATEGFAYAVGNSTRKLASHKSDNGELVDYLRRKDNLTSSIHRK